MSEWSNPNSFFILRLNDQVKKLFFPEKFETEMLSIPKMHELQCSSYQFYFMWIVITPVLLNEAIQTLSSSCVWMIKLKKIFFPEKFETEMLIIPKMRNLKCSSYQFCIRSIVITYVWLNEAIQTLSSSYIFMIKLKNYFFPKSLKLKCSSFLKCVTCSVQLISFTLDQLS